MGTSEKADGLFRADFLQLVSHIDETVFPATTNGQIKLSGSKLYVADGTDWNLITSA